jgi:geranylgeranylglycerol-phosphate geranylgeranyltransferase
MVAEIIKRVPMLTFLKAYIKSMRLYYSFVTGIAGWIGFLWLDVISI